MLEVATALYKNKKLMLKEPLHIKNNKIVKVVVIEINEETMSNARNRQLKFLQKGFAMGKILTKNRNEIYAR